MADIPENPLQDFTQPFTYEEAITKTGSGKFHYFLLLVCGLCFMAGVCETIGVGIVMYSGQCDLHFTLAEKGILATAGIIGMMLNLHISGFLQDTRGRVKIMRLSLLLCICSSIVSVFSVNTLMLILVRFLTGVFISGFQSCVFTLLAEYHGNATRARAMSILSSFLVMGVFYVNLMAYIILNISTSWRVLLVVFLFPSILGFIGLMFLPESPRFLLAQGRDSESLEILRKIYRLNTGNSESSYEVKNIDTEGLLTGFNNVKGLSEVLKLMGKQTLELFHKSRIFQTINMCIIDFIICAIGVGITMWLPTMMNYLVLLGDGSHTVCSAIIEGSSKARNESMVDMCADPNNLSTSQFKTLIYIAIALLFYYTICSSVITVIGRKPLLLVWFVLGALAAFTMFWSSYRFYSIFAITLIYQIGKFHGLVLSAAADYYPPNINAMGVSFVTIIGSAGLVFGGNITGPLFLNHCNEMFFGVFGVMVLVICLTMVLPKDRNGK